MKVRRDDNGVYIAHGDNKVRPIAPAREFYMAAFDGKCGSDGSIIRSKGMTEFKVDDVVKKYHIGSTISVRVSCNDIKELWFIHDRE